MKSIRTRFKPKTIRLTVPRNPICVPSLGCRFGGPDSLNAFNPVSSSLSLMLFGRETRGILNGSQSDALYSGFMLKNSAIFAYSALENDASLSGKGDLMESTSIEKNLIRNKIAASGLPSLLDSSLKFSTRDCSGTLASIGSSSPCRTRFKFFGATRQDQNSGMSCSGCDHRDKWV